MLAIADTAVNGLGNSSLLLFGVSALVLFFPWQRLSTLRAGPIEFALEHGQVRGALDAIKVDGPEKERVERTLSRLVTDIERARGSRVLWVDDRPSRLVGERRLFRALGIETVTVRTCHDAALELNRDNDFDLLITSVVKSSEQRAIKDSTNPTALFIRWLRGYSDSGVEELVGREVGQPPDDAVINNLRVIVYAALKVSKIWEFLQPVAGLQPPVDACSKLDELLPKAIRMLADLRANPIEVSIDKLVYVKPENQKR